MTCIVGLAHNGQVWMGGDSAGVNASYGLMLRADQKVFRNGPFLMGFTTSFRMGQLLRHSFTPPDHDPRTEITKFMVTTFVDAVRQCFKAGGFARANSGEESGGDFLVGYRGRLFVIQDDYQVGEPMTPYAAVGCAEHVAMGAMFTTEGMEPAERIRLALQAAERFSAGVRAPFCIECLSDAK